MVETNKKRCRVRFFSEIEKKIESSVYCCQKTRKSIESLLLDVIVCLHKSKLVAATGKIKLRY